MGNDKIVEIYTEIEEMMLDVSRVIHREFQMGINNRLTQNQQYVLLLIAKGKASNVKDLAKELNISASAVSQILSKLEQQKIVKRSIDESSRRNIIVQLDVEGLRILQEFEQKRSIIFNKYVSKMTEADLTVFRDSFKKLKEVMIEEQERGTT
ncbi:MarR family transcriptional regulator [Alkalihalobacillus sp. LMS39]|uniref:MarR family winged helix-turn-helix transcriptional regulator n=1 Tax=Alkalihalobacillus sp. LMS39 TaxID=2924032 RepID=UPI001FB1FA90|nr:MarR family transcriptional regulator [Alkalihalobacillus sp. LMS39]UOE92561.1 MarR family transcriptional regulator [Alkalihalobacillus sp. LMS39]